MGGLRRLMPITYLTAIIGSLALAGIPPFAGFFSKDAIIEAVHYSSLPGASLAYYAVLAGVVVTAFYSFRLIFLVFHGKGRMDDHTRKHLHESPGVVTLPLVLLAIPSIIAGMLFVEPMLFGDFFGTSIQVDPAHDTVAALGASMHGHAGAWAMMKHAPFSLPFWLAIGGIALAWLFYIAAPGLPAKVASVLAPIHYVLVRKYGVDELYQALFAGGSRRLGGLLWRVGDVAVIDGFFVNGSARVVGWCSALVRHLQTGFVYHYAFAMILGLLLLMSWFLWF